MFEIFVFIVMTIAVVVGTYGADDGKDARFMVAIMVGLIIVITGGVGTGVVAAMGVVLAPKDLFRARDERIGIKVQGDNGIHMEGIIRSIEAEDGSGMSFNLDVVDGQYLARVYYHCGTGRTYVHPAMVCKCGAMVLPECMCTCAPEVVREVQYTNGDLFTRTMEYARSIHRTIHDNGNTLVLQTRTGTETYDRTTLIHTYRGQ